jgi:hypothetical protein
MRGVKGNRGLKPADSLLYRLIFYRDYAATLAAVVNNRFWNLPSGSMKKLLFGSKINVWWHNSTNFSGKGFLRGWQS